MARETAKARQEREAKELEALMQARRETYPRRFREAVASAVNEGFELTNVEVNFGKYTFNDRDTNESYDVYDEFGLDGQSDWSLEDLEQAVASSVAVRAEQKRKIEVRQNALAKLSKEERELLGLK